MREFMSIAKALSDPSRVRVLLALRGQELCACQITELFGLAQSTMSKHFYLLRQAGLVESRKEGRWVYYSLPQGRVEPVVREALDWVFKGVGRDSQVKKDERRLREILSCDPVELCRRQCSR